MIAWARKVFLLEGVDITSEDQWMHRYNAVLDALAPQEDGTYTFPSFQRKEIRTCLRVAEQVLKKYLKGNRKE